MKEGKLQTAIYVYLASAHNTFQLDIEAMYLFLISKASYRYFPIHVKH